MGLDNFNVAPDNKGGRPEKDEEETDEDRTVRGEPFVEEKADKSWWLKVMTDSIGQRELPQDDFQQFLDAISTLADHVHTQPINVLHELEEHEIQYIEWEWVKENSDERGFDARWPGEGPVTGSSSPSFGSTSSYDSDSGLGSIIDAAK